MEHTKIEVNPREKSSFNAPWSLRFERDGTEDVAVLCDAGGVELARSRHFWLPNAGDPEPPTLAAMRLIQAAPALLKALAPCASLLADYDEAPGEEGDAYREAMAAIDMATNPNAVARSSIEITEDEFDERFPLLTNPFNPNATWSSGDEGGYLFETYGEELEFVQQQDPATVWTLVDGDWKDMYLVSGFHVVNRLGFLISTVPVPEGTEIEVRIVTDPDDDSETDDAGEA